MAANLIICLQEQNHLEGLQLIKGIRYKPFRPQRHHQIARCLEWARQISMNIQITTLVCHRELNLTKVTIPSRVQASI